MRSPLSRTLAVATLGALLALPAAHAQEVPPPTSSGTLELLSSTSTTFLPLTTTGVAELVIFLVRDDPKAAEEHAEIARLFLRQNAVALAQELAEGEGPVLEELAAALGIRAEHLPLFRFAVSSDRRELARLADPEGLDRGRALRFVRRLHGALVAHADLREDLQRRALPVR